MADKTTTLKTKTNDNVYPNVIGDNRDNAIVDSAHINHTLTADHKINFRLDTNVSGLIFNSLQKPAGLTKTKLVGVGTNGQENIEIGDNLTLANGKLSATGGGKSIPVIEGTEIESTVPGVLATYTIPEAQTSCFIFKCDLGIAFVNYNSVLETYSSYFETNSAYDKVNDTYKATNIFGIKGTGTTIHIIEIGFKDTFAARLSNTNYANGLVFYGENDTLYNFMPPSSNNKYLTYNTVTNKYEWSTPTGGNIPSLPSDASTSTYVLKAVNGTVQWVKES